MGVPTFLPFLNFPSPHTFFLSDHDFFNSHFIYLSLIFLYFFIPFLFCCLIFSLHIARLFGILISLAFFCFFFHFYPLFSFCFRKYFCHILLSFFVFHFGIWELTFSPQFGFVVSFQDFYFFKYLFRLKSSNCHDFSTVLNVVVHFAFPLPHPFCYSQFL